MGSFTYGSRGPVSQCGNSGSTRRASSSTPRVWKNGFLFSEIDLRTREASDDDIYVGELYAGFENISGQWGADDLLNVRVGRFYLPFGEEYQKRMVLDDPADQPHSASDIWGLDQGVEAYGKRGDLSYVVAVQNGGNNQLRDFNADKSVTGRIGYDPAAWLHLERQRHADAAG